MSDIIIEGKNLNDIDQSNFQTVGPYTNSNKTEVKEPWQGRDIELGMEDNSDGIVGINRDNRISLGTYTENQRGYWEDNTMNPATRLSQLSDDDLKTIKSTTDERGLVISEEQSWSVDTFTFVQSNEKNYPLFFYYDKDLHPEEYNAAVDGKVNMRIEIRESGRGVSNTIDNFMERRPFRPFLVEIVVDGPTETRELWKDASFEGDGFYTVDKQVELKLESSPTSHFINWTEVDGDDEIEISTNVNYSFIMPLSNKIFKANMMHNLESNLKIKIDETEISEADFPGTISQYQIRSSDYSQILNDTLTRPTFIVPANSNVQARLDLGVFPSTGPDLPPENYIQNSTFEANLREDKPSSDSRDFNSGTGLEQGVGATSDDEGAGGLGFWIISGLIERIDSTTEMDYQTYSWTPNLHSIIHDGEFNAAGTISEDSLWEWDGSAWNPSGLEPTEIASAGLKFDKFTYLNSDGEEVDVLESSTFNSNRPNWFLNSQDIPYLRYTTPPTSDYPSNTLQFFANYRTAFFNIRNHNRIIENTFENIMKYGLGNFQINGSVEIDHEFPITTPLEFDTYPENGFRRDEVIVNQSSIEIKMPIVYREDIDRYYPKNIPLLEDGVYQNTTGGFTALSTGGIQNYFDNVADVQSINSVIETERATPYNFSHRFKQEGVFVEVVVGGASTETLLIDSFNSATILRGSNSTFNVNMIQRGTSVTFICHNQEDGNTQIPGLKVYRVDQSSNSLEQYQEGDDFGSPYPDGWALDQIYDSLGITTSTGTTYRQVNFTPLEESDSNFSQWGPRYVRIEFLAPPAMSVYDGLFNITYMDTTPTLGSVSGIDDIVGPSDSGVSNVPDGNKTIEEFVNTGFIEIPLNINMIDPDLTDVNITNLQSLVPTIDGFQADNFNLTITNDDNLRIELADTTYREDGTVVPRTLADDDLVDMSNVINFFNQMMGPSGDQIELTLISSFYQEVQTYSFSVNSSVGGQEAGEVLIQQMGQGGQEYQTFGSSITIPADTSESYIVKVRYYGPAGDAPLVSLTSGTPTTTSNIMNVGEIEQQGNYTTGNWRTIISFNGQLDGHQHLDFEYSGTGA